MFRVLVGCVAIGALGLAPGTTGIPSLASSAGYLNATSLAPADLQGKVVLVDFWDYTCINCLRTLPYLRAWYDRYKNDGFTIVGVHTPEFDFAGNRGNLTSAVNRLQITWPVALDNNAAIWKRFNNDSWPHEYLFDQQGKLIEQVIGEGNYQATEARIQALLKAANPSVSLPPLMALLPQDDYVKPGAVCYPKTNEMLIVNAGLSADPSTSYSDPGGHQDGTFYLSGRWHFNQDAAQSNGPNDYAAIRYHAIQVVSVLGNDGKSVRVDVTQDGNPVPHEDAGPDLKYDGKTSYVDVDSNRAYDLIDNAKFGQHELRLASDGIGLDLYSFAFESCEVPGHS